MMPEGWQKVHISDLVGSLDAGVSVNGMDRPKCAGEVGVLKVSAVSYGVFNPTANKAVISEDLCRVKESPRQGHIIVSRSNSPELVAASALVDKDYPDLFLSDKLWQLKPKSGKQFCVEWLAYYLDSPPVRYRLSKLATGTSDSMKNISKTDLLTLRVYFPPITEQNEIAKILNCYSRSIDLTERLIAAKQERRTWLMQQLMTGKRRLPGFDGEWRNVHLGDVFTNRVETNFPDLPLVAITGSGGVVSREDLVRRDTSSEDKSKYLRICPGDIGYNTMRMWQGVCGLSELEGIVSPAYTIVTPKADIVGEFMALLFKSLPVIHLFHRHSQGLVDDTLNLKWRHFAEIKVAIPEKDEQQTIAAVFRTADRELDLLRSQLDALREQKKGLMQQLLNGKLRVTV